MKPEEKKQKLRKRILFAAFVLLNVVVIAWTAFSEFANSENAANLADVQIKWWLLIPAALMFLLMAFSEVYKYYLLVRETHSAPSGMSKKALWKVALRTVFLGRYYDNITPASIGGQPFQIYYMHKKNIQNGYNVVVPLIGMITDQIGFLIIGTLSILIGSCTNAIWSPAIVAFGWIGLLVFAFFPLVILGGTFLPRATEEIMGFGIKFLAKLHIIKDAAVATEKARAGLKQYTTGVKTILREKGLFLKVVILGILVYTGQLMIPYFVLLAFGAEIGLFASFATTAAVSAAVYFVPTPGNAGAAEGVFYSVFSVLPKSGYVFWAMLLWRFFIYYLWLIIGGITQARIYYEDKSLMKNWNKGVEKADTVLEEQVEKIRKEPKEPKEPREPREPKEPRTPKEPKESKEPKGNSAA